eukprot:1147666-Pelagomonas_calceolata.AAC.14
MSCAMKRCSYTGSAILQPARHSGRQKIHRGGSCEMHAHLHTSVCGQGLLNGNGEHASQAVSVRSSRAACHGPIHHPLVCFIGDNSSCTGYRSAPCVQACQEVEGFTPILERSGKGLAGMDRREPCNLRCKRAWVNNIPKMHETRGDERARSDSLSGAVSSWKVRRTQQVVRAAKDQEHPSSHDYTPIHSTERIVGEDRESQLRSSVATILTDCLNCSHGVIFQRRQRLWTFENSTVHHHTRHDSCRSTSKREKRFPQV